MEGFAQWALGPAWAGAGRPRTPTLLVGSAGLECFQPSARRPPSSRISGPVFRSNEHPLGRKPLPPERSWVMKSSPSPSRSCRSRSKASTSACHLRHPACADASRHRAAPSASKQPGPRAIAHPLLLAAGRALAGQPVPSKDSAGAQPHRLKPWRARARASLRPAQADGLSTTGQATASPTGHGGVEGRRVGSLEPNLGSGAGPRPEAPGQRKARRFLPCSAPHRRAPAPGRPNGPAEGLLLPQPEAPTTRRFRPRAAGARLTPSTALSQRRCQGGEGKRIASAQTIELKQQRLVLVSRRATALPQPGPRPTSRRVSGAAGFR